MPVQGTPTTQLAHELRETIGRLIRRLRAEPGPSVGRMAVLGRLDRDGPASISDLAGRERIRPQSMAQTVHDLESAGLVSRRPDPADGRRAFIELTSAGLDLLQTTRARRETWLTEALEREFDADERAVVHEALALLSRIADAVGGTQALMRLPVTGTDVAPGNSHTARAGGVRLPHEDHGMSRRVEVSNWEFSGEGATAFLNLDCQETSNGGLPQIERRPP